MNTTLAFDVYGTLIDTNGVVAELQNYMGDNAAQFAQTWREKQLEYSFRRAVMQTYVDFSVCTRHALEYTCEVYPVSLTSSQKNELLNVYRVLPAFSDVNEGLARLQDHGYRLYAFSNGKKDAVEKLLDHAGISDMFLGVVSVDDLKTFKPSPDVYAHFLKETGAPGSSSWLISSNPFDVIGAISAGMKAAWIRRSAEVIFDPWGIEPTVIATTLTDLPGLINSCESNC